MNFLKSLYSPFVRMRRSQKMSNRDDENRNEDAVAGPSNVDSPPKLFTLNVHCFDEIFEYLCVQDLHSFGLTCKQMNKVAGVYFKQNYLSAQKYCDAGRIYTWIYTVEEHHFLNQYTLTLGFNKFMPCISLSDRFTQFNNIKSYINEFESTSHIHLRQRIDKKRVKYLKKLLPQVEIVHIQKGWVVGDFYDLILKYCKNLREIHVERSTFKNRIGRHNWLLKKYPKLECLHFTLNQKYYRIEQLRKFFENQRNIRRFLTNARMLWNHGDIFLNSSAKLDILVVTDCYLPTQMPSYGKQTSKTLLELLNQLHEQGFYKQLHIYFNGGEFLPDYVKELSTEFALVKGLELLSIDRFHKRYNLDQLTNLKEIIIMPGSNGKDMEILANALTKLDRLCISATNIDVIMPFIRQSLKLNKIKLVYYGCEILNLAMLNEERAKLIGARKITIYVSENVFLNTKWTTRNGDSNLSFIEMRRSNSIQWLPYNFQCISSEGFTINL